MTMIEDIYAGAFVRRWGLVSGFPECVADALPVTDSGAIAALQVNAGVRELVDAVEAYETAEALLVVVLRITGNPNRFHL